MVRNFALELVSNFNIIIFIARKGEENVYFWLNLNWGHLAWESGALLLDLLSSISLSRNKMYGGFRTQCGDSPIPQRLSYRKSKYLKYLGVSIIKNWKIHSIVYYLRLLILGRSGKASKQDRSPSHRVADGQDKEYHHPHVTGQPTSGGTCLTKEYHPKPAKGGGIQGTERKETRCQKGATVKKVHPVGAGTDLGTSPKGSLLIWMEAILQLLYSGRQKRNRLQVVIIISIICTSGQKSIRKLKLVIL